MLRLGSKSLHCRSKALIAQAPSLLVEFFMVSSKKKGLVLLSGGIDSTVTLWWVLKKGWQLSTLTFLYPGRKKRELWAMDKLCSKIKNKENFKVTLPFIDFPRPEQEGYIPQKNLIYYGVAASLAEKIGAHFVLGGHHKRDGQLFPDAEKKYLLELNRLIGSGTRSYRAVELKFPFLKYSKEKIIQLGAQYGVPYEYTWSCSHDKAKHCWECISCLERKNGFQKARILDPLLS